MEARLSDRSFNNYRLAISEPEHFFGRGDLIQDVCQSPFQVRILLGGRRIGKTSVLNAIRWNLLSAKENQPTRAFPVLFDLQQEQPENLDHLRYLLIARLQEAIHGSQQAQDRFMRQLAGGSISLFGITLNVTNPAKERRLIHEDFRQDFLKIVKKLQEKKWLGVCFLLDGSEFIVNQPWANNAWSYLRSLKETTNTAIEPFLGLLLSGYRDLRDYQQKVGSPLLGISELSWLSPFEEVETKNLIGYRCSKEKISLSEEMINGIIYWAGCHPYLTQQLLNTIFDNRLLAKPRTTKELIRYLIRHQHEADFSKFWDSTKASYGFGIAEQMVYLSLIKQRQGTAEALAQYAQLSIGDTEDALRVMTGTGVIRQLDFETYAIGAKLFEQWVSEEKQPEQI
ncbi:ATP-binding protein [Trichocoleus sp. FACHB-591]|uniref:ATP-binding protein n=1 Tax=Trichocoleus sp. FACHB-591 TaxID=2692872 RepID=UPI00168917FA|nr:ATP-binding protein [Trichocoleus sp. FACHB-591]MBD2094459.1 ATP-binding protein [Trichocoleus sp. FACHB-591]